MARRKISPLRRILIQTDRAFWCVHDHLNVLSILSLPTFAAILLGSLAIIGVPAIFDLPAEAKVFIVAFVSPLFALFVFTLFPLPCAVFAWKAASGESASVGECFAYCLGRSGRLFGVFFRLGFIWLGSLLLLGLPLLWLWPRTCLAPLVALFEDEPRIFRRSRKILREDFSVEWMGFLFLGMGIVLGGLVLLPRLVFGSQALGAHLIETSRSAQILEYLWIFEAISVAILVAAIATSWNISLALVYHDIRMIREGEDLKRRIAAVRESLTVQPGYADASSSIKQEGEA